MPYTQILERSNATLDALGQASDRMRDASADLAEGAEKMLNALAELGASIGTHSKALLIQLNERDFPAAAQTCNLLEQYLGLADIARDELDALLDEAEQH